MAKNNIFDIIRNGKKLGKFELLKYAKLNTGYVVYLFRGSVTPKIFNYIVSVKKGDQTVEFIQCKQFSHPFSLYLDYICCYA